MTIWLLWDENIMKLNFYKNIEKIILIILKKGLFKYIYVWYELNILLLDIKYKKSKYYNFYYICKKILI